MKISCQRHFICLSILLLSVRVCAQSPSQIPSVVPPSPDAASLGKYAAIPVGLHTGIPEISIPIYVIKTKKLSVPITLSYHAGGNKVKSIAEWTGLGWSLNAGGVISRSVQGLEDDNGFLATGHANYSAQQIHDTNTPEMVETIHNIAQGVYDNESDIYFYNFGNHSGKFVFDRITKKPFLIPYAPIDIKYDFVNQFTVTDEDGTVYTFGTGDSRELMSYGYYALDESVITSTFNSSWYLKTITSADGSDVITFNYGGTGPYRDVNTDYTEVLGAKCETIGEPPFTLTTIPSSIGTQDPVQPNQTFRDITSFHVSSIVFSGGKVDFTANPRTDVLAHAISKIDISKEKEQGVPGGSVAYETINTFRFNTGYFKNHAGSDIKLKLDGFDELGKDYDQLQPVPIRSYKFSYNEGTSLPDLGEFFQDWWGYFNITSSVLPVPQSLIQKESVLYGGFTFHVGSTNREPNATAMQIHMLNKITYPTGGYTEFEYEPHYFHGEPVEDKILPANAGKPGVTDQLDEDVQQFTAADYSVGSLYVSVGNMNDPAPIDQNTVFPTVTITRLSGTPGIVTQFSYDPGNFPQYNADYETTLYPVLEKDQTYEIRVRAKGPSASKKNGGSSYIRTALTYKANSPYLQMVGGLRIKSTKDYTDPTATPVTKIYKYGVGEDGAGVLMTPVGTFGSYKEERIVKHKVTSVIGCYVDCLTNRMFIHAYVPQDLTTLSGAPVIYPMVTVYQNSPYGPNGKDVYQFELEPDLNFGVTKFYKNGEIQISNDWKGQNMTQHDVYKGYERELVKQEVNTYTNLLIPPATDPILTSYATKVGYQAFGETTCFLLDPMSIDIFYYFDYPINSGVRKLTTSTTRTYSQAESQLNPATKVELVNSYSYNIANLLPTSQITTDSKGQIMETHTWYSVDYTGVPFDNLSTKHILSTPIKQEQYRATKIIKGQITYPDNLGNPVSINEYQSNSLQLPPADNRVGTTLPTGYIPKATLSYDATTRNLKTVQRTNDVAASYLWGYNKSRVIAQVTNAPSGDFACASFENASDESKWTFSGSTVPDVTSPTGKSYYTLTTGAMSLNTLQAGSTYTLSYWVRGGSVNVNLNGGTSSLAVNSTVANGWTLTTIEKITGTTSITLSGAVYVDEVRIRPSQAQMTTYTYDNVVGVTTVCDPANVITRYEYDNLQRLKRITDNNGNIVKMFDYSYAGN